LAKKDSVNVNALTDSKRSAQSNDSADSTSKTKNKVLLSRNEKNSMKEYEAVNPFLELE
jgi:hypothetical protein